MVGGIVDKLHYGPSGKLVVFGGVDIGREFVIEDQITTYSRTGGFGEDYHALVDSGVASVGVGRRSGKRQSAGAILGQSAAAGDFTCVGGSIGAVEGNFAGVGDIASAQGATGATVADVQVACTTIEDGVSSVGVVTGENDLTVVAYDGQSIARGTTDYTVHG